MKIVQLMAGDEEGGLENHFVELSNGLAKIQGLSVVAIGHPKYRERFSSQVKYHCLDLSQSRNNPVTLVKLIKLLRREKALVIHAQANKAAAMLNTVKHWVPGIKVATIHNQKKSIGMFSNMQGVVGVSKGVVANLTHANLKVIYNGMEAYSGKLLSRAELAKNYQLDADKPITIAIGRLVPTKAFDNLINAWDKTLGQLIIFGDGPEKARLELLIQQRELQPFIILAGFYSGVRSILQAADLLVFSSHREGYSYAMAEALLAELPVLSTRVAGAEETLPEEQLVPVDNVAALSAALKRCLSDLDLTRRRMQPVFLWAQKTLTVDNMVAETHKFYQQLLDA